MIRSTKKTGSPSDSYLHLIKKHPLISIRSETELDKAQAVVDELLTLDLDEGGVAYLEAISDLILLYEQEHHAIAALPPHRLLGQMLQERSMSQADLVRATGLAKATVSDLVTGKRAFTVEQMHLVGKVFSLPGVVFMGEA
ncbi:MAG TPA: helix-turn-helix domain-containing protein [Gemmatales bacterium]|nr:helix-turn-helix domain-containing protein [Gemmatales bacterium]